MDNFPLSETNWEIIQISSEIHKICSDIFPDQLSEVWGARKMWKRKKTISSIQMDNGNGFQLNINMISQK